MGWRTRSWREIGFPRGDDWKEALRARARAARAVFIRHAWAIGLVDTRRSPGAAPLRRADAEIGTLREGGFSLALTLHAHILLDSYIYGFALQETSLPVATDEESDAFAEEMLKVRGQVYPHLAELTRLRVLDPGFGLELILDRLDELRSSEADLR